MAEALKKLDYYVVMDVAWNSSCDYADIVLPAATQYESADQFSVNNGLKAPSSASTRSFPSRWASATATGSTTSIWP